MPALTSYPRLIQDRALDLFCDPRNAGMDMTQAVAAAETSLTPREKRALSYLQRFGHLFRQVANGVLVPSESSPGMWYLVEGERCSCRDRGVRCKHIPATVEWLKSQI